MLAANTEARNIIGSAPTDANSNVLIGQSSTTRESCCYVRPCPLKEAATIFLRASDLLRVRGVTKR